MSDTDKMPTATRLALIEQAQVVANEKLDELLTLAKATNGRVTKVEMQELTCQASGVTGLPARMLAVEDATREMHGEHGLPARVRALENLRTEMQGVVRVAKWAVGGGLLGLLSLLAQLLGMVK